ncbi:hypothetical protein BN2364_0458 [Alloalcanivorax xenomutans]|nr:hypothetical protein BN2364_0458 [Alloalcanivorax xenomutans]
MAGGYRSVNQTVIFFTTCTKVPLSLALSNGAARLDPPPPSPRISAVGPAPAAPYLRQDTL